MKINVPEFVTNCTNRFHLQDSDGVFSEHSEDHSLSISTCSDNTAKSDSQTLRLCNKALKCDASRNTKLDKVHTCQMKPVPALVKANNHEGHTEDVNNVTKHNIQTVDTSGPDSS